MSDRIPASAPRLLAAVLALVAVLAGGRTGFRQMDVDEAVYRRTLLAMREGSGYYDAMRDALIVKEGAPPDSVRAIRPPTMFLLLRWITPGWWRVAAAPVLLAVLLLVAELAAPLGRAAGLVAVTLAGTWMITASPLLFLHQELWGLPFFLGSLLALRNGRDLGGAALMSAAGAVRELYLVGLVIALFVAARRAPWVAGLGALTIAGFAHVLLAADVVASGGHQVALGNEALTPTFVLSMISPGSTPAAWPFGVGGLILGCWGLVKVWSRDRSARLLLLFTAFLLPLAIVSTRAYWSLTFGPALAAYVSAPFAQRKLPAE